MTHWQHEHASLPLPLPCLLVLPEALQSWGEATQPLMKGKDDLIGSLGTWAPDLDLPLSAA